MDIKDVDTQALAPEPENFQEVIGKAEKLLESSEGQPKVYVFSKPDVPSARLEVKREDNGDILVRRSVRNHFSEELDSDVQDTVRIRDRKVKEVSTSVTPISHGIKSDHVDTYSYNEDGYSSYSNGKLIDAKLENIRTQITSQVRSVLRDLGNLVDKEQ